MPISYHARAGESNLRPIYDDFRILGMFARNLFWKPETKNFSVEDAEPLYSDEK